jgi:hypothetical protein
LSAVFVKISTMTHWRRSKWPGIFRSK